MFASKLHANFMSHLQPICHIVNLTSARQHGDCRGKSAVNSGMVGLQGPYSACGISRYTRNVPYFLAIKNCPCTNKTINHRCHSTSNIQHCRCSTCGCWCNLCCLGLPLGCNARPKLEHVGDLARFQIYPPIHPLDHKYVHLCDMLSISDVKSERENKNTSRKNDDMIKNIKELQQKKVAFIILLAAF